MNNFIKLSKNNFFYFVESKFFALLCFLIILFGLPYFFAHHSASFATHHSEKNHTSQKDSLVLTNHIYLLRKERFILEARHHRKMLKLIQSDIPPDFFIKKFLWKDSAYQITLLSPKGCDFAEVSLIWPEYTTQLRYLGKEERVHHTLWNLLII